MNFVLKQEKQLTCDDGIKVGDFFFIFFFIIGVLFREWVEADVLIREGAAGYEQDRTLRQPSWSWRETGFRKHTYWQEHNMHTCMELGQRGRD